MHRQVQRVEWHLPVRDADYLHFVPAIRSREELADLSARVNWYLPESSRTLPIYVDGVGSLPAPSPIDAPHMEPSLVHDAGWVKQRPRGKAHVVLHRVSPRGGVRYLTHLRDATFADPEFFHMSEEGFFRLHRHFCSTQLPSPEESLRRIETKRVDGGSALVLATGPTAKLVDPDSVTTDIRIVCNSAVRDHDLITRLRPDIIVFSDPVFHFGPSKYASAFREDLLQAARESDAILLTSQLFSAPLLAHHPELAERLAVIPLEEREPWRWPTASDPSSRMTGNVLTNLMLPAAFAIADRIEIAGCDGRDPNATYFWSHNAKTQYSDELMQAAFEAHPAFFRDRDYADYYAEHCRQLEELLATGESGGRSVSGLTPSHIPALLKRGAPTMPTQASSTV